MTSECFVPVCYGGGIRNINDAYSVFNLGVEKISVQKLILEDFKNLSLLVSNFGSSSIVFSVDIIKKNNKYCVYDYNKKKIYSLDFITHIKKAIDFGAGEIYLNMVDLDGTLNGPDLKFLNEFSSRNKSADYAGFINFNNLEKECFGFGKYKGREVEKVLKDDPGYFGWVLNSDFPRFTKKILTEIRLRKLNTK